MKTILLRISIIISISFISVFFAFAQSPALINGQVTSDSGEPLSGVTVQVKNSRITTLTRQDGSFQINAPSANSVLVFSYVGFSEQQVSLNGKQQLSITMTPSLNSLENVIVVGYGTQKKRNVTGSVATFNAENLDERPVARVDQALVGQMAGVRVNQTSGVPGRAMSIQVRGSGSISAGNEPLYVIDGFPLATAAPNNTGSFPTGNPLDNINPNDIESVQVLKDASAAAIYGSRAANGVVLITTKKGKTGRPKINLNTYAGISQRSRRLDMLSAEEWIDRATEIINGQWVASGAGRTASQTNEQRRVLLGLPVGQVNSGFMTDDRWLQPGHPGLRFIDWQDEAFRKGLMQNYQLSASGGTEAVKYYVSGNYVSQEGMVKGMDYSAYSARANVEVSATRNLKFGINIAPTYSITNDPGVEGKDAIIHHLVSFTPVQEDTMGLFPNTFDNGQYRWSISFNSPYARLLNTIGQTKRYRTLSTIFADYQIVKGLVFRSTANFDNTDNSSKFYRPFTIAGALTSRQTQPGVNTTGSFNGYRKQTFVNENTLSYNTVINDDHDISLLAGASYNSDKIDRVAMNSAGGFGSSVITTLNAASAVTGNTTETKNVLLSYFGRAQYSLLGKYLLSASLRRDGSSRFGANTKWGTFPSASIGWRLSDENFIKNISQISDLKLRGSWGKSGNYTIPDYGSFPLLGTYNYTFGGVQVFGQAPSGIPYPDLSWEKAETYDIGIDFGILRNRFTGSFDYYTRTNTALLLNQPIPAATGFPTSLSNVGKVKNNGWEVELTSRNLTGALQWTTSLNFSHNQNKVVELPAGQTQIFVPSEFDIPHSIIRIGHPINSINVVRQIGIISPADTAKKVAMYGRQTVGDPKYFDANGDGIIDADDRVIVGQPNPKYIWGITNTVRYKGFDLNVLVQGQWGGSIYSLWGRAINRTGQGFTDNAVGEQRDRWRSPENPGAGKAGKARSTFGRIKNTDWLYPSDYVRVRNITLGYNLGSIFKTKAIQAARIYATAENFFGYDKYTGGFNPEAANTDVSGSGTFPEAGDYGGLPLPRSLILGLNFTF